MRNDTDTHLWEVKTICRCPRIYRIGLGKHPSHPTAHQVGLTPVNILPRVVLTLSPQQLSAAVLVRFQNVHAGWVVWWRFFQVSSLRRITIIHMSRHSIRTVYFFLQQSPLQFKVCAIFQLSIDVGESESLHPSLYFSLIDLPLKP